MVRYSFLFCNVSTQHLLLKETFEIEMHAWDIFNVWKIVIMAIFSAKNQGYTSVLQWWTKGRSSTAVAEDLRSTATATVAEVWGHSYGRRQNLNFL